MTNNIKGDCYSEGIFVLVSRLAGVSGRLKDTFAKGIPSGQYDIQIIYISLVNW